MKNKITDVFFDLDHTLWDFDRNSALAFQRVFNTHKIEIPVVDFMKVYEPINFAYWKEYREERVTKEVLRRGRLQDTFSKLNLAYELEIIDLLSDGYIEELPGNNHLFDGAIDLLEYLKNKYSLHIITNGFAEVQNIKMERSKLAPYFKTVTSSEEVGVKKPNPIVFHTALEKTNAKPETSIMIGDTFEADILGAESVGMDTIFYNYRNEVIPTTYKAVDTLLEIKKYL
ncbi:MAG: YjjG family noncanonical pyrimidine nucleotidase [Patiriisocius sp.]|uniref:YjjG family noncanonical pyrimidine nucleotidase n=1 Tax=Patiriisocius sp. TaxID=2822396 RepID=UPI003EF31A30